MYGNDTYVQTADVNKVCTKDFSPWPAYSYTSSEYSVAGSFPMMVRCTNTGPGVVTFGLFSYCMNYVTLYGHCVLVPVSSNTFELVSREVQNRAVAAKLSGSINWVGAFTGSKSFTLDSQKTIDQVVSIRCGDLTTTLALSAKSDIVCASMLKPIYKLDFIVNLRCTRPGVFLTSVVLLILMVIQKILIWTGLDIILYPIYGTMSAFIIYPFRVVVHKYFGCKTCGAVKFPGHYCLLHCCGVDFKNENALLYHQVRCKSKPSFIKDATYFSRSVVPSFVHLCLCIILLMVLVPTSYAKQHDAKSIIFHMPRQVAPTTTTTTKAPTTTTTTPTTTTTTTTTATPSTTTSLSTTTTKPPQIGSSVSFLDCDITLTSATSVKLNSIYGPLSCSNLWFIGFPYGYDETNALKRSKRSIVIDVPPPHVMVANLDPELAELVKLDNPLLTDSFLSGHLNVELEAVTGYARQFKVQTSDMKEPLLIGFSITDTVCNYPKTLIYKTCRTTFYTTNITEKCTTVDPTACATPKDPNLATASKIWPDVQNWGCEEPGCLSINTGCLGATCVCVPGTECCDVLDLGLPTCYITVCVTIHNSQQCYTLTKGITKGPITLTWSYQDESAATGHKRLASCSGSLYSGEINGVGEFDNKFGAFQVVNKNYLYKPNPTGYYHCHAVSYKDVAFSTCALDTYHLKTYLKPEPNLIENEFRVKEATRNLGIATVKLTINARVITESSVTAAVTIESASCVGYPGPLKGVNCTCIVKGTATQVLKAECTDMVLPQPTALVHTGPTFTQFQGFTQNPDLTTTNCTFTNPAGSIASATFTVKLTELTIMHPIDDAFYLHMKQSSQEACNTLICTFTNGIVSFFSGAFNIASIISALLVFVLSAVLIYMLVMLSVRLAYSCKATYSQTKDMYIKSA